MMMSHRRSYWHIFRWPIALATTTMVGLVSALIGDGIYDLASWIALGLDLVVMLAAWRNATRGRR